MAENRRLKGKTALVTGGRRGIGKAIALALAEAGADVAVNDAVSEDGLLQLTKGEMNGAGSRSIAVQADISRRGDVENMVRSVLDEYGKIDILVNCAGVWIPGETLIECSEQNWDKVINTNLKGTYLCCQAVGKTMIPRKKRQHHQSVFASGINSGGGRRRLFHFKSRDYHAHPAACPGTRAVRHQGQCNRAGNRQNGFQRRLLERS